MSNPGRVAAEGARRELKGRHVLMMLIAFFGVVFSVNGVFLAQALQTYTGVVSVEPYVKGLKYNDRIAAGERQAKLGWHETLSLGVDGAISLAIADDGGRPVRGLKFVGSIGRPSTNSRDRAVALVETDPGRYVARTTALDEGTWVVAFEATSSDHGADPVYRLRRRIWLKH
jgi:nitrogen fixation protein FixH